MVSGGSMLALCSINVSPVPPKLVYSIVARCAIRTAPAKAVASISFANSKDYIYTPETTIIMVVSSSSSQFHLSRFNVVLGMRRKTRIVYGPNRHNGLRVRVRVRVVIIIIIIRCCKSHLFV